MEKTLASLLFFLSLIIPAELMSYALAHMAKKRSFVSIEEPTDPFFCSVLVIDEFCGTSHYLCYTSEYFILASICYLHYMRFIGSE